MKTEIQNLITKLAAIDIDAAKRWIKETKLKGEFTSKDIKEFFPKGRQGKHFMRTITMKEKTLTK